MKKVFFGLLIIAAGAGVYYYLHIQKNKASGSFDKELLAGKWKLDSLTLSRKDSLNALVPMLIDSNFMKHSYSFTKDGKIFQLRTDSVKADTAYYSWNKKNELLWKETVTDSIGEVYTVSKLKPDSLVLQSKDSTLFVFTKLK